MSGPPPLRDGVPFFCSAPRLWGAFPTLGSRVEQREIRKVAPIKPTIAGKKPVRLLPCMRTDEEIGNDSDPPATTAAAFLPQTPGKRGCIRPDRVEGETQNRDCLFERLVAAKTRPHLGPNHIAGHEGALVIGSPQRLARPAAELRVGAEDIEQDRRVNRRLHCGSRRASR